MKLSDQERIKKLSEDYTKAVRAMRALDELAGEVKFSFGTPDFLQASLAHTVVVDATDRQYVEMMTMLRLMARRRVGELHTELRELGVDPNA